MTSIRCSKLNATVSPLHFTLGCPDFEHELEMLFSQNDLHSLGALQPVMNSVQVIALQEKAETVRLDKSVAEYILRLVGVT